MPEKLQIRNITTAEPEYQQAIQMIQDMGLPLREAQTQNVIHMAAFDGERMLGYLAVERTELTLHIFRVAVNREVQRSGIGSRLVSKAEQWAIMHGCSRIIVESPMEVAGFFEDLAYGRTSEISEINGNKYLKMIKDWSSMN